MLWWWCSAVEVFGFAAVLGSGGGLWWRKSYWRSFLAPVEAPAVDLGVFVIWWFSGVFVVWIFILCYCLEFWSCRYVVDVVSFIGYLTLCWPNLLRFAGFLLVFSLVVWKS
jgi:hypothetical protein